MLISGPDDDDLRQSVLLLKNWCTIAPSYNRKRTHGNEEPRLLICPAAEVVESRKITERPTDVKTDEELDALEDEAPLARVDAKAKGKAKAKAKAKGRPPKKAGAKTKAASAASQPAPASKSSAKAKAKAKAASSSSGDSSNSSSSRSRSSSSSSSSSDS